MKIHDLSEKEKRQTELVWEVRNLPPFQELILSWNGFRPKKTPWHFSINIADEWLPYAEWGPKNQKTFHSQGALSESHQDIASLKEGSSTSFQVKVTGDLAHLHSLYANTESPSLPSPLTDHPPLVLPNLFPQSQMVLDHPRHRDLCSPTSTTTAIHLLLNRRLIDPAAFAERIRDTQFDIYGNWVLNTAEAYHQLQGRFRTYVQRLPDFTALYKQLEKKLPVVVSVKGPLPGAPLSYDYGHLLCVIGYEAGNVICIDSAFPSNETTLIRYPLSDFLKAWGLRKNLCYRFDPR